METSESGLEDATHLAEVETAFWKAWEMINRADGWRAARAAALTLDGVDRIEWRRREERFVGDHVETSKFSCGPSAVDAAIIN